MSTRRTHPLEWAALGCAIVSLSYTEWSLAVAAGAHPVVAVSVPGALDIYAIRAMRTRRHVPYVVCAMVGVNALSYLVHAGVVPVTWPVLVIVSAIAPLVFWAVHSLGHGDHVPDLAERRKRLLWDVPMDAELDTPGHGWDTPSDTYGHDLDDHVDTLPVDVDDWGTHVHGPAVSNLDVYPFPEDVPERDTPAVVLQLPEGFEKRTRRTREELIAEGIKAYGHDPDTPTLRQIKDELKCNTEGARAVLEAVSEFKKGERP